MAEESIVNKKLDEKDYFTKINLIQTEVDSIRNKSVEEQEYLERISDALKKNFDIREAEISAIKKFADYLDTIYSGTSNYGDHLSTFKRVLKTYSPLASAYDVDKTVDSFLKGLQTEKTKRFADITGFTEKTGEKLSCREAYLKEVKFALDAGVNSWNMDEFAFAKMVNSFSVEEIRKTLEENSPNYIYQTIKEKRSWLFENVKNAKEYRKDVLNNYAAERRIQDLVDNFEGLIPTKVVKKEAPTPDKPSYMLVYSYDKYATYRDYAMDHGASRQDAEVYAIKSFVSAGYYNLKNFRSMLIKCSDIAHTYDVAKTIDLYKAKFDQEKTKEDFSLDNWLQFEVSNPSRLEALRERERQADLAAKAFEVERDKNLETYGFMISSQDKNIYIRTNDNFINLENKKFETFHIRDFYDLKDYVGDKNHPVISREKLFEVCTDMSKRRYRDDFQVVMTGYYVSQARYYKNNYLIEVSTGNSYSIPKNIFEKIADTLNGQPLVIPPAELNDKLEKYSHSPKRIECINVNPNHTTIDDRLDIGIVPSGDQIARKILDMKANGEKISNKSLLNDARECIERADNIISYESYGKNDVIDTYIMKMQNYIATESDMASAERKVVAEMISSEKFFLDDIKDVVKEYSPLAIGEYGNIRGDWRVDKVAEKVELERYSRNVQVAIFDINEMSKDPDAKTFYIANRKIGLESGLSSVEADRKCVYDMLDKFPQAVVADVVSKNSPVSVFDHQGAVEMVKGIAQNKESLAKVKAQLVEKAKERQEEKNKAKQNQRQKQNEGHSGAGGSNRKGENSGFGGGR